MYPCNGILLSPQNAVNPDTGYSVEGGEDIILGEKRQGLRDSTCMRSLERSDPWRQKADLWGRGLGVGSCCLVGTEF